MLSASAFDKEGFLRNLSDWDQQVAEQIAATEGLELHSAHWEILQLLRAYYREYVSSPAMRALVKYCALSLGPDKGKSIYLMSLFPGSPARIGSKIAGLPKPTPEVLAKIKHNFWLWSGSPLIYLLQLMGPNRSGLFFEHPTSYFFFESCRQLPLLSWIYIKPPNFYVTYYINPHDCRCNFIFVFISCFSIYLILLHLIY